MSTLLISINSSNQCCDKSKHPAYTQTLKYRYQRKRVCTSQTFTADYSPSLLHVSDDPKEIVSNLTVSHQSHPPGRISVVFVHRAACDL